MIEEELSREVSKTETSNINTSHENHHNPLGVDYPNDEYSDDVDEEDDEDW